MAYTPDDWAAQDEGDGQGGRWGGRVLLALFVLLAPVAVLAAMVAVDRAMGSASSSGNYAARFALPPSKAEIDLPRITGSDDPTRPLVVIDAGHGGHDPGAGEMPHVEKEVTLALALALRDRLVADGGIRVALTRDNDRYLLLEDRSGIARRMKADLFVSIHADSTEVGNTAKGATIYTLSARGTSEQAEKLAASENRADTVNGVSLARTSGQVSAILVDLAQRHSGRLSDEFARLILREGEGRIAFREKEPQSAAFVVLKSPDVPSVLFESGYINNPEELARLRSDKGRAAFAEVTARAIRVFFARQSTDQP
ncbi:N-acetylmuramoyl-L-alanine amidase [Novosphingobium sp. FSY-8]|uniref:N-acetylmuramoyl-L-alanine amidase n=1 Tax=Novosphingobium ovatum TaxID=1908523 RepID=A0ABW9XC12_9SPHN|nr:N-acetylmuramoyl-L-alanine amidase [Novosphingobium ovatum]NBC36087.1 N-acetylmuramoyl-L-alanine amidase [Novosphingobium ovatum]